MLLAIYSQCLTYMWACMVCVDHPNLDNFALIPNLVVLEAELFKCLSARLRTLPEKRISTVKASPWNSRDIFWTPHKFANLFRTRESFQDPPQNGNIGTIGPTYNMCRFLAYLLIFSSYKTIKFGISENNYVLGSFQIIYSPLTRVPLFLLLCCRVFFVLSL